MKWQFNPQVVKFVVSTFSGISFLAYFAKFTDNKIMTEQRKITLKNSFEFGASFISLHFSKPT